MLSNTAKVNNSNGSDAYTLDSSGEAECEALKCKNTDLGEVPGPDGLRLLLCADCRAKFIALAGGSA